MTEIGKRSAAGFLLAAMLIAAAVGSARAEQAQKGDVKVSLNGGIAPLVLPRHELAPVALTLAGGVRSATVSSLPRQVKKVEITVAGRGSLVTAGLPICPRSRLANADSRQALQRCRQAQVGSGWLNSYIAVPHQAPFSIHGRLLAFNGRTRAGGPAIWLHLFATDPPVALVLPVVVHRKRNAFSTRLSLRMPRSLRGLPHLSGFFLTLFRRFRDRGERRSYLSASCPLPPKLTAGFFSIAHATYTFADGRRITVETARSCRAP